MRTSKFYWFLMGMLSLGLWPVAIAAPGDWRIGQAQELLKAAGFDPGFIDGVLGRGRGRRSAGIRPAGDYQ